MFLIYFLVFIIGLIIGSFLNLCIYRIPRNQSIIFPSSHCPKCNNAIKKYDLIPLFSYIFLKGKCRNCSEKISIKYPFVELMTGIFFLMVFLNFNLSIEFFKSSVLLSILIVVTYIDLEYSIIPGKLMIFALICGIIFNIVGNKFNNYLLNYVYGFLVGGGTILLIVLLTGGMGGGDIQLMSVIGLFLGFKYTLVTLMLSFILGAIAGITLIILKKKSRKDYMPFGPWISIAAFISLFWGQNIINWYISLL